jgi:membrane-associated phospholipid phosphatase
MLVRHSRVPARGLRAVAGPMLLFGLGYGLLVLFPALTGAVPAGWLDRLQASAAVQTVSRWFLEGVMPATMAIGAVTVLLGRRWAVPGSRVRAFVLVPAAIGTADLLKLVLPVDSRAGALLLDGHGSFPSGHTASGAAFALAVLSTLPAPARRRLFGPLLAWTVAVGAATVTADWHRPGDAWGGLLVAVCWHRALFGGPPETVRGPVRAWWPRQGSSALWWLGAAVLAVGGAASCLATGTALGAAVAHTLATAILVCLVAVTFSWAAEAG